MKFSAAPSASSLDPVYSSQNKLKNLSWKSLIVHQSWIASHKNERPSILYWLPCARAQSSLDACKNVKSLIKVITKLLNNSNFKLVWSCSDELAAANGVLVMFLFGVEVFFQNFEHVFAIFSLFTELYDDGFTYSSYVRMVMILFMTFSSMSSNCAFSSFSCCW